MSVEEVPDMPEHGSGSFGVFCHVAFESDELMREFERDSRKILDAGAGYLAGSREEAFLRAREVFHRLDRLYESYALHASDVAIGYITLVEADSDMSVGQIDRAVIGMGSFPGLIDVHYVRFINRSVLVERAARDAVNGESY